MLKKKEKKINKIFSRLVQKKDQNQLLKWANDISVRRASKRKKKISFIEHEKWFNKKLNNQNSIMYIFCIKKKFVGQVRFDKVKNKNFISYSVDKEYRRKGYGKEILKKAINKIKKQIKFKEVYAKVMKNNIASLKIFESLSFECYYKNHSYFFKKRIN